ncbi:MAG: DUF6078 family protein [Prevotella sp.]|nr:DUF6078 family protein [Prevotella sp.]
MTKQKFSVPQRWAVCFNRQCPRKDNCLRYVASTWLPKGVTAWATVMPWASEGGECQAFCDAKTERMAWGLEKIYAHVAQADYRTIKVEVMGYLGGKANYYRYHRGEKHLTEEQQAGIAGIFKRHGYSAPLPYGNYCDEPTFVFMPEENGFPY